MKARNEIEAICGSPSYIEVGPCPPPPAPRVAGKKAGAAPSAPFAHTIIEVDLFSLQSKMEGIEAN
jgi:hypothetical protein